MDETEKFRRPDAPAVAARVLCLASVCAMADVAIDLEHEHTDAAEADEAVARLREWSRAEGLTDLYGSAERELIERHPSTWTRQEVMDATWLREAIGALLWALWECGELPGFDREFDEVDPVPMLESTERFVRRAVLRPAEEIDRARAAAELWHWRARKAKRLRAAEGNDLDAVVRDVAAHAYEHGDIAEPIDGDFPAFGKAFRDLTDDEYASASSIAVERHLALNWVCGYSDDWDGTPTDT
jgi:hypothetical protein